MMLIVGLFLTLAASKVMAGETPAQTDWYTGGPCGISKYPDAAEQDPLLSRIVGGIFARAHEFPWQVALAPSNMTHLFFPFFCGGSVINRNWILTAAHCVVGIDTSYPQTAIVWLGEHTWGEVDQEKARFIEQIIPHADYDDNTFENDIALIKLTEPLDFSGDACQPICEPDPNLEYTGVEVVASGWGDTQWEGDASEVLKYAKLLVISNDVCNGLYDAGNIVDPNGDPADIHETQLCASDNAADLAKSTCQGDSGGPLAIKEGGVFKEVGIVSFSVGCASGYPAGFARVNYFLDWIDEHMPWADRI